MKITNTHIALGAFTALALVIGIQSDGIEVIEPKTVLQPVVIDIAAIRGNEAIKLIKQQEQANILNAIELEDLKQKICLTSTLIGEGIGESVLGKKVIAKVIINRVASPKHPNTICKVVKYKRKNSKGVWVYHFSMWNPKDKNFNKPSRMLAKAPYTKEVNDSIMVAKMTYEGKNNVVPDNALNYHADHVNPNWAKRLYKWEQVGAHIIYTNKAP